MKDIHERCLFQWIQTMNIDQCELCHAPLHIEFNHELERTGYLNGFNLQVLTNPALHIMIHCLVMLFFCSANHFNQMMTERFLQFQLIYNGTYITLLYYFIQRRVQNKNQYLLHLVTFPCVLILLINIYLWLKLIDVHDPLKTSQFIILSLMNQSYMGLYPLLHNHILDQINHRRHPMIIPRHNH